MNSKLNDALQRTVVITGTDDFLASNLAAYLCLSPIIDEVVYAMLLMSTTRLEALGSIKRACVELAPLVDQAVIDTTVDEKLTVPITASGVLGIDLAATFSASQSLREVWYVSGECCRCSCKSEGQSRSMLEELISASCDSSGMILNYVGRGCICTTGALIGECSQQDTRFAELCRSKGISVRVFRTSIIVGSGSLQPHNSPILQFLSAVHELKVEITERLPEYFDYEALYCLAPIQGPLNFISVKQALRLMLAIAQRDDTHCQSFNVVGSHVLQWSDFLEWVGMAYELSIIPADKVKMNAIDDLFHARVGRLIKCLTSCASEPNESFYLSALEPDDPEAEQCERLAFFEAMRITQKVSYELKRERVRSLPARLERKTIYRDEGQFSYSMLGSDGDPIVVLNALGQPLDFWFRLLEQLEDEYRIIIWDTSETSARPYKILQQVEDMEAILYEESIDRCHVVGWCTGPKAAVEFYLRRPNRVASMVLLNSQFKCESTPDELLTTYERRLSPVFRMLCSNPAAAGSVASSLQLKTSRTEPDLMLGHERGHLGITTLALTNRKLTENVATCFRNEAETINYAHQIIDFWNLDSLQRARLVDVPVLIVSAEYDRIASPQMSRAAAQVFPRATYVEMQGATHYCLFDSPGPLADLIRGFLKSWKLSRAIEPQARSS